MSVESFVVNVTSPVGPFAVVGTREGVEAICLPSERWRASRGDAPAAVAKAAAQLREYFHGSRRYFDLALAPVAATEFQREVWSAVAAIPYGQVRTYGEVAGDVRRPFAARAVGNAAHVNPWPIVVPCHRVVGANSLGGYGGGEEIKRFLLELEGVL